MSTSEPPRTAPSRPHADTVRRGGVAVSAAALAAVLTSCGPGPVDVATTSTSAAVADQCRELIAALPDQVGGQDRRDVDPADALAAAWGDPAIVLRCGVPDPTTFKATSQCWAIDHVMWFATDSEGRRLSETGSIDENVVFTTIGRSANVQVVVPAAWTPQSDALFDVASAVRSATSRQHGCS